MRDDVPSLLAEAVGGPPEIAPDPTPPSALSRALSRLRSGKEPARAVLRRFRRPHGLGHETTVRFIREAERRAQRRAGLVRLVVAALLIVAVEWAARGIPDGDPVTVRQIEAARVILGLFALLGLAVYLLARKGTATGVLPFATALGDAVLILGGLAYNQWSTNVPGNFLFSFPIVWVIPIALAGNAV